MREWLYDVFRERPWWMSAVMVFSAYMAFIYLPWDILVKPVARDEEVWFGILFYGFWAKLGALLHWLVYAAAVYGFRRRRPWMAFWAPAYVAQVAFSMYLWTALDQGGFTGALLGLVPAAPFAGLAYAFWHSRDYFSPKSLGLVARYGDWSLVTGASSGIGAALARAIATEGMNVVLTARREERLTSLASELERDFAIETRVVVADLAEREGQAALLAAVEDLEIGLLANNAGVGCAGRFDLLDGERLRRLVTLNCEAPLVLSHALVQGMRERGRGAILFTGSIAGRHPLPLHAAYAATKGFDLLLGEALWAELRASNIDVAVLEPDRTETEFQEVAGEIPHRGDDPDEVARIGLAALGQQPSVIVGWYGWIRSNLASRLLTRPIAAHAAHAVIMKQTPEELR
ncbi:MAG: SDR family NAD(P)-dependent oxidoreductase [Deltaproteobacteria bacterium]|jgi:short-subunit dehydrogenase|nr:SDR family NAD(P)-dependent oxidoreductase [Deltaproteobacteria bacterium]MBW2496674.1 SDR family NAD(P)-dependent oxidoreductase [Deltaproteobacteria bacterium]